MKTWAALALAVALGQAPGVPTAGHIVRDPLGATVPLLTAANLVYVGAVRFPYGDSSSGFDYSGTPITYNPARHSIFAGNLGGKVAELLLPAPVVAASVAGLPRMAMVQPLTDPFDGRGSLIGGTPSLGGMLVSGNALTLSAYLWYDGTGAQTLSHFTSGLDLSLAADAKGPYQVGAIPNHTPAGFVSGAMAPIPIEWQAALGGPALTGNCCMAIISRTSLGPSVSVFDPATLGLKIPAPATWVLGYPSEHPAIGAWDATGQLFNGASGATTFVFPQGTRSVLFFGRLGTGPFCYGPGVAPSSPLAYTLVTPGVSDRYCPELMNQTKGTHAYPYQYEVWAYDVLDLIAVKQGKKQPWQVVPYATWSFHLPFENTDQRISAGTYDPSTRRVLLVQDKGDGSGPVLHVFQVTP